MDSISRSNVAAVCQSPKGITVNCQSLSRGKGIIFFILRMQCHVQISVFQLKCREPSSSSKRVQGVIDLRGGKQYFFDVIHSSALCRCEGCHLSSGRAKRVMTTDCMTPQSLLCSSCPPIGYSLLLASLKGFCDEADEWAGLRQYRFCGTLSLCANAHRLLFQRCLESRQ